MNRNYKNLVTVVIVYPDDIHMTKSIKTKSLKELTDKSADDLRILIDRFGQGIFQKIKRIGTFGAKNWLQAESCGKNTLKIKI